MGVRYLGNINEKTGTLERNNEKSVPELSCQISWGGMVQKTKIHLNESSRVTRACNPSKLEVKHFQGWRTLSRNYRNQSQLSNAGKGARQAVTGVLC